MKTATKAMIQRELEPYIQNDGATQFLDSEVIKEITVKVLANYTISSVVEIFNESFQYEFVDYDELTPAEKNVYDITDDILRATGTSVEKEQIYISKCLQPDFPEESFGGVWEEIEERIVIHRGMLRDVSTYAGVLVHELVHADTGFEDVSRSFETVLTKWIGYFAAKALT